MKLFILTAVLLFAQAKTTQDGVYTAAQATRGEAVYGQKCTSCHGADLAGDGQASPLAGKDFHTSWSDQTLNDLFERIRATMPADAPGSLKPEEVADVIAYILNKNDMAAGETELPADASALKAIKFTAPKP
jgi:S-disulfanyl-L-cysteine oxidoreductase SoxD